MYIRALVLFLCLNITAGGGAVKAEPLDGIGTGRPLVIEESMGGSVNDFRLAGLHLLYTRTPIIVDGPCYSACTLLLDEARPYVCLTTRAVLGYHKAAYVDDQKVKHSSELYYETPGLNDYLNSRGGLPENDDLMLVPFEQAKQFYTPCKGTGT